jgi:hypothetical protein
MNWDALTQAEFNILANTFLSGSAIAELPQWRGLAIPPEPYDFESYSGTYLSLPEFQSYFEGYHNSVKVIINNVTVQ